MDRNKVRTMWIATMTNAERTRECRCDFFADDREQALNYVYKHLCTSELDKPLDLWPIDDMSRDLYMAGKLRQAELQPHHAYRY